MTDEERAAHHRELALAEHVRRIVATFPPLTPEQRDIIAALLWPPSIDDGGQQLYTRADRVSWQ